MVMDVAKNKGIALLFAVLTLSVILAVAMTIINVIVKQIKISSSGQDSVRAIYAADSGIECALLWDIRGAEDAFNGYPVFPTSTISDTDPDSPTPNSGDGIECAGVDILGNSITSGSGYVTSFSLNLLGPSCAEVEVTKYEEDSVWKTIVLSKGYNVACNQITGSTQAVERAIKVQYQF